MRRHRYLILLVALVTITFVESYARRAVLGINATNVEIEVNAFTYNDGDYQLMFGEGDSENNPYIAAGDNFVGEDPVAIFYVPDEGTEFLNAGTVIGLAAPSVPEPDEGDTTSTTISGSLSLTVSPGSGSPQRTSASGW